MEAALRPGGSQALPCCMDSSSGFFPFFWNQASTQDQALLNESTMFGWRKDDNCIKELDKIHPRWKQSPCQNSEGSPNSDPALGLICTKAYLLKSRRKDDSMRQLMELINFWDAVSYVCFSLNSGMVATMLLWFSQHLFLSVFHIQRRRDARK